jgi:micrococcal nuclease
MKKILILLLVVLTAAACGDDNQNESVVQLSGNQPPRPEGLPEARVDDVIDGDTIDLDDGTRIRLIGINTPEREQYYYDEASDFTRKLLEGKTVGYLVGTEPQDQYGRTLAYVWVGDRMANYEILRGGYANSLFIAPNIEYQLYLQEAEQLAVTDGIGLWQGSDLSLEIISVLANPPGMDEDNLNGEYVVIRNLQDESINLNGFSISDAARNTYIFGDVVIEGQSPLRLLTGCGNDQGDYIYWCSNNPIWNNSSDTAFLYDASGRLVDRYDYTGQ